MRVFNLTPRRIIVKGSDGKEYRIPSNGTVRLTEKIRKSNVGPFEVVEKRFESLEINWPKGSLYYTSVGLEEGTIVVVPPVVLQADHQKLRETFGPDAVIVAPDLGPSSAIRDKDGKIVAIRRFVSAIKQTK